VWLVGGLTAWLLLADEPHAARPSAATAAVITVGMVRFLRFMELLQMR
jgi:hypothetical protein